MKHKTLTILILALIGLLVLAACSAPAATDTTDTHTDTQSAQAAPERVEVILTEFGVESSITEFEVGKTYQLVITNEGVIEHELRITPPADADAEDKHGDDEHSKALLIVEAADLGPGETATVEYTFDDHATEESLEFACHIAGHYEANMRLAIAVE